MKTISVLLAAILLTACAPAIEVHVSYASGECVRVVDYTNGQPKTNPCPAELPNRYTHVWIR